MSPSKVENGIKWAKMFDSWRIFPRLFILTYLWLVVYSAFWFMGLQEPNGPQSAFIGAVIGAGAAWFGLYVNSGPDRQTLNERTDDINSGD